MAIHPTTLPQGWRRFDSTDWMGMAGAERFHDGTDPLIKSTKIDGRDADLLIDATGATVIVFAEDESMGVWDNAAPSAIVYLLTAEEVTIAALQQIGFTYETILP